MCIRKKYLLIIAPCYFREQHRLQQEQRKAARSAKKEAPKEEIGVQLKKKAPAQKDAKAPEPQKEAPKLKKVEKIKADSPVRRSQSPDLPQLKRVEQNKRAESPMRTASPIPKLKSVALRTPTGSREGTPVKVGKQKWFKTISILRGI